MVLYSITAFWLIGKETYQTNKIKKYTSYAFGIVIFVSLIIGSIFFKTPLSFRIPGWWGIGIILILLVITTIIFIIDAILGIGSRIPILDDLLTQPISKSTALWVIIIGGPIVAIVCGVGTYYYIMRNED